MAIFQGATNSFKKELLEKVHNLTSDSLYIALYSSSASLGPNTTAYSATNEITGTGYVAGGKLLTGAATAISNNVAYVDFTDAAWTVSTLTARGALIYNSSASNKAIWVLNFGSDRTSTASTFTVRFPSADSDSAIIRIG